MNELPLRLKKSRSNRGQTCFLTGLLLSAILSSASWWPAAAQDIGDPATGRRLAEKWCNSCHVVDPNSRDGVSTGAPTFAAVARMSSTTALALRVFLQTPHEQMPDLHLTREETDNVIAYILSLRSQ